ncbi:MAG TPA: hypothetical protein PLF13_05100 [candidate division Zixibacteria bacterium]|nr:hypothetical protein [candidate division Zixibacteria bacterium]
MKKLTFLFVVLFIAISGAAANDYIVLGWNDLGMHCSNKDFSTTVVLPPFNVVYAQIIKVGDSLNPPALVSDPFRISYSFPGNTYSVGKTNFWDYSEKLFGAKLTDNIGLTGAGLSGDMHPMKGFFIVEGVPLTPYTDQDLINEDPFQLASLTVYDEKGNSLASTRAVVPVSNEINCVSAGCHASELEILQNHTDSLGDLTQATPILCAGCHSSNALGTEGQPGLASLSETIHSRHGEITDDCYKCHPGPKTKCLRGVMANEHGLVCQDCHGSVIEVGKSIKEGRQPWLMEPSCGAEECHGTTYAEEQATLYRLSRGHGKLFCSACHGEPHAIAPSRVENDNVQNTTLQGKAGVLRKCSVCHGYTPAGEGPHGLKAADL